MAGARGQDDDDDDEAAAAAAAGAYAAAISAEAMPAREVLDLVLNSVRRSGKSKSSPAFSQPCLCLSDTRHLRNFRRFRGFEERSPCFQLECKFVIFAVFVKNGPFLAGDKTTVYQNHDLCHPEKGCTEKGQTPICNFCWFLQFSAVSCEICSFLRKAALPHAQYSREKQGGTGTANWNHRNYVSRNRKRNRNRRNHFSGTETRTVTLC